MTLLLNVNNTKTISIVVPIYNEEKIIFELYNRLQVILIKDFSEFTYQIIFVDDGSSDTSFSLLKKIQALDDAVCIIQFSRNFGHHIAITAGLDYAHGDFVVLMDGDLQDQPEEIIKLYSKLNDGFDVVFGERINKKFSWYKRFFSWLFLKILRKLTDQRIPINTTIFRMMKKQVVGEFTKLREQNRYIVGIIGWVGFNHTSIPVEHGKRFAGESKYDFYKQCALALDAVTSFSGNLLKIASFFGFILVGISFLLAFSVIVKKYVYGISITGWASLMSGIFFLGGIQIFFLGILGEYIGRIYLEAKARPLYVVREILGFGVQQNPHGDFIIKKEKHGQLY